MIRTFFRGIRASEGGPFLCCYLRYVGSSGGAWEQVAYLQEWCRCQTHDVTPTVCKGVDDEELEADHGGGRNGSPADL